MVLEKNTEGNKKKEKLHVIPVSLKDMVVIWDDENVNPEFSNAAEHE